LAALDDRQPLTEAFSEWSDDVGPKFRGFTFRAEILRDLRSRLETWKKSPEDPASTQPQP
jgi:hypothetical protein